MPVIRLTTMIHADQSVVFDLSRSVELHLLSTERTNEIAVDGKTSGLLGMGDWVKWRAKHLGFYQELSSKITFFDPPNSFIDEMLEGAFESFRHEHNFHGVDTGTRMEDVFEYKAPFGIAGKLADFLFLKRYMEKLLMNRNRVLKHVAESEQWKELMNR